MCLYDYINFCEHKPQPYFTYCTANDPCNCTFPGFSLLMMAKVQRHSAYFLQAKIEILLCAE